MNADFFIETLKDFPEGLDMDKVNFWLKNFTDIENFTEIEKLFLVQTSFQPYYMALKILFSQKYLRQEQYHRYFEGSVLEKIDCKNHTNYSNKINIFRSKSKKLAFKDCTELETIIIWSCYNISKLYLSNTEKILSVHIQNLRKLSHIEIKNKKYIKYFSVTQCGSFIDFDIIKGMDSLLS